MKKICMALRTVALSALVMAGLSSCDSYEYVRVADDDLDNMHALQFTEVMGNGINLGNTMEATSTSYNLAVTKYETAWGQPETTAAMIAAYRNAGFKTLRIPVAWTNTMDWRNGDYTINDDYLNRVKEIIDWAYDNDMFVIVNDHWDNGWWGLFGSDSEEAWKVFNSIWTQVGTYFKDYDCHLIFEAGNEELGDRFNDTVDGVSGTLTEAQQYKLITQISQQFVNLIRSQGSYNDHRFLLIPGYSTDIEKTCSGIYKMPEDSTNEINKLLISVHYYNPSTYTIADSSSNSWGYSDSWGTASQKSEMLEKFCMMKSFTRKGYGVIVGEYGVTLKSDKSRKSGDADWLESVLDCCDSYGYCPVMWDTGTYFKKTGTLGFSGSFEDVGKIYLAHE